MKHAYLIIAHNDFYLLKKLIQVIDNPAADIFIHIDAKSKYSAFQFDELKKTVKYSCIYIYSKIKVSWGGTSQVQCELFLMKQASSRKYGYYHLL